MDDEAMRLARTLSDADVSIYGTHAVQLARALIEERAVSDRLCGELVDARAALRKFAPKCEHRCGSPATIRAGDETQEGGAFRFCDNPKCRGGEPAIGDAEHAAALRAAGSGR